MAFGGPNAGGFGKALEIESYKRLLAVVDNWRKCDVTVRVLHSDAGMADNRRASSVTGRCNRV